MKSKKIIISLFVLVFVAVTLSSVFAQKVTLAEKSKSNSANLGQAGVTIEEKIVRMAYRKMNVLDSVERFVKAKRNEQPAGLELAQRSLRFNLRDFRVGEIQEIQNAIYRDLVTPPTGEIIQVSTADSTQNGGETKVSLDSKWRTGQYSSGFDPQWTVGDVLQLEAVRFNDVGRYASYEVTVSLEGKIRTYRALALFHNLYQPKETLNPEFLDSVVGMGGVVTQVLRDTRLPLGMKRSSNQATNLNNNFNDAKTGKNFSKKTDPPQQDLMCAPDFCGGSCLEWYYTPIDPTYTFCMTWEPGWGGGGGGGGGGGQSCTPRTSITNPPQLIDHDSNFHLSGNHLATTRFQKVCSLASDCTQSCQINNDISGYNDNGVLDETFYYHVGGSSVTRRGNTGPQNSDISCETAIGYSFKRCLVDCGVSVTVGISGHGASASVTVTGGDLWNVGHIDGRTCRNGQ